MEETQTTTKSSFVFSKWHAAKVSIATFVILVLFLLYLFNQYSAQSSLYINDIQLATLFLTALIQLGLGIPLYLTILIRWKFHGSKLLFLFAAIASFIFGWLQWQQGQFPSMMLTSSFIVFVTALLQYFEEKYLKETDGIIQNIKDMRPTQCSLKKGNTFENISVDAVKMGDIYKVSANQIIPLDGVIISGITSVDESNITGEFKPLLKSKDDFVIAGTLNRDNDILVEVKNEKPNNVIDYIVHTLEENFGKRITLFKKIEKYGKSLSFLGIVLLAVLAYYVFILKKQSLDQNYDLIIAFLLSFASISLASSVIIATNIFVGNLFQNGILIKKGDLIETLSSLQTLFFDKTGTITKGNFEYSQTYIELGTNQGKMLSTLFSLESQSHHAFSNAMDTHPWYYEIPKHNVKDFKSYTGLGICGTIQPKSQKSYFAAIGTLRFLKRNQMQISRDMKSKLDDLEAMGETVLLCGYNRQVKGLISFSDVLRPHVRETLKAIINLKIEPAIISGDSEEDIFHLINNLHIKKVYARCTPEEKIAKIGREINNGKCTGYVRAADSHLTFDKAHISITLDTGTNIIDQNTDIILMGSNFNRLAWLLNKSKSFFKNIQFHQITSTLFMFTFAALSVLRYAQPELIAAFLLVLNLWFLRSAILDKDLISGQWTMDDRQSSDGFGPFLSTVHRPPST